MSLGYVTVDLPRGALAFTVTDEPGVVPWWEQVARIAALAGDEGTWSCQPVKDYDELRKVSRA